MVVLLIGLFLGGSLTYYRHDKLISLNEIKINGSHHVDLSVMHWDISFSLPSTLEGRDLWEETSSSRSRKDLGYLNE